MVDWDLLESQVWLIEKARGKVKRGPHGRFAGSEPGTASTQPTSLGRPKPLGKMTSDEFAHWVFEHTTIIPRKRIDWIHDPERGIDLRYKANETPSVEDLFQQISDPQSRFGQAVDAQAKAPPQNVIPRPPTPDMDVNQLKQSFGRAYDSDVLAIADHLIATEGDNEKWKAVVDEMNLRNANWTKIPIPVDRFPNLSAFLNSPTVDGKPKQPWQMKPADYLRAHGKRKDTGIGEGFYAGDANRLYKQHKASVLRAVQRGLSVPSIVLRHYPEITQKARGKVKRSFGGRFAGSEPGTPAAQVAATPRKPRERLVDQYMNEHVNYGGEIITRGELYRRLKAAGGTQGQIDMYVAGARATDEPLSSPEWSQAIRESEKPAKATAPRPGPAREPWQITQGEFSKVTHFERGGTGKGTRGYIFGGDSSGNTWQWDMATNATSEHAAIAEAHREFVESALREGKPVPPDVLKDYPELKDVRTPAAAEPWQMTREKWLGRMGTANIFQRTAMERRHIKSVESALSEGKPVPPKVLADYPELKRPRKSQG